MPPSPTNDDAMDTGLSRTIGGSGGGNMKKQIAELLQLNDDHTNEIGSLNERLGTVEGCIGPGGASLKDIIDSQLACLEVKMLERMKTMQEEMEHKFSLQVAENKRMQQHLSTAKRENQAMAKRLLAAEERLKAVESELGGDDDA